MSKKYVLRDVDINTIDHKSGRTIWGCKQCGVNYCKKRECWLALPRHKETAISGVNRAFPLVEREDNKAVNPSDSSILNLTNFR